MYWGLDTISGVAVHTPEGRTFYPDTRVLGVRGGELLLTQDVTGSEEFDYEDAAPDADLIQDGDRFGFPLTPYRIHRIPLADILDLHVETLQEGDEDSLTSLALSFLGAQTH